MTIDTRDPDQGPLSRESMISEFREARRRRQVSPAQSAMLPVIETNPNAPPAAASEPGSVTPTGSPDERDVSAPIPTKE